MLSERMLTTVMRECTKGYLKLKPTTETMMPGPVPGKPYMLYMHVPFCERLCPYCSFNRFPFREDRAVPYFENMRKEMRMLKDLGYDFDSVYIGGGTPTIMIDELCETIDQARDLFNIKEVSSETNPNHLIPSYLEKLQGRVQRLSVGVQSFDDGLLKQMDRYDKYGCGQEIMERIQEASPYFVSMNADMIFNFPAQTEEILIRDIERVIESGASQTTFYPLMASPSVEKSLARTVGKVDYDREKRFYEIICELL
ncbi:MAG: radical SAM protein, partial [Eggerthellaceae bacterium]|nr:radical SAM protein [Eggerthellaceae bacterium]